MSKKLFQFHPRCSELQLTYMCFADDLLIFAFANMKIVEAIKYVLDEVASPSELSASPSKSTIYCSGIPLAL